MTTPRVSICIPTYQGASTIGATIDSALGQSDGDFELIVVDDGSPDETQAVVASRPDVRVRYVRNERNLGPQGNWDRCLSLARGRYIKLLPHDDLLHAECLARQVQVLELDQKHDLALVCCSRDVIGPSGKVLLRARGFPGLAEGPLPRASVVRHCLRRGTNLIGEPGAVLFRRELVERVGGFDMRHPYVIDLEYWLRLLQFGRAWYDPQALASFRVWGGSWSVAIGTRQAADFRGLMADVLAQEPSAASPYERACGQVMPVLNSLARQVFYRLLV